MNHQFKWIVILLGLLILVSTVSAAVSQYNTSVGSDYVIKFNGSGTINWTPPTNASNVTIWYLIVAGGGGGGTTNIAGSAGGGGGGAGGLLNSTFIISNVTNYTITVGAGGAGSVLNFNGSRGGNSSISNTSFNVTSVGGGGGASYPNGTFGGGDRGGTGGSGGGSCYNDTSTGGLNISGQGFYGGKATTASQYGGGGGGGAGGDGGSGTTTAGGAGGVGLQINITGCVTYYAGGGGGSINNFGSTLGAGGAGGGVSGARTSPSAAPSDYGGGGGGGSQAAANGGTGGSGVVIIRYSPVGSPVASFTMSNSTGWNSVKVNFTDASTLTPTSWNWTFGGANFSDAQYPNYTFVGAGNYTVILNASNSAGWNNTTNYVTVFGPGNYGNNTTFFVNSSVNLTYYTVRLLLNNTTSNSNVTGIFYTNGTTRTDWNDIVFTDSSDNLLDFWMENHTQSATNSSFWIELPDIWLLNNTTIKMYYGCSTQSVTFSNGTNTFPLFDDFDNTSVQTSLWSLTGAVIENGSIATIPNTGVIESKKSFGVNTAFRSRVNIPAGNAYAAIGFENYSGSSYGDIFYTNYVTANVWNIITRNPHPAETSTSLGTTYTGNRTYDVYRNGTGSAMFKINDTYVGNQTTNLPIGGLNITLFAQAQAIYPDWVLVRNFTLNEPIIISANGSTVPPSAGFTMSNSTGWNSVKVNFTDTSTFNPTSWNWTFGGANFSDAQYPNYTFVGAGNYTVILNVSNSVGWSNITKYVFVGKSSDYGNTTTFFVNSSFNVTNYQVMIRLNNTTGGSNTSGNFYTNGTTLPNWFDVVFTDSSDNLLGYWRENHTDVATNTTFWINIPNIWSLNNTTIKMYYGCSTSITSFENGYNTFQLFDDFLGDSLNTSQWSSGYGSGNMTFNTTYGSINLTTVQVILSNNKFNVTSNITRSRHKASPTSIDYALPAYITEDATYQAGFTYKSNIASLMTIKQGDNLASPAIGRVENNTNYYVSDIYKTGSTYNLTSMDSNGSVGSTTSATYTSSNPLGNDSHAASAGLTTTVDFSLVRKYRSPEPVIISANGTPSIAPIANFTMSNTTGWNSLKVNFTDTSTNSPTSWNWTFGGANFSDAQYPNYTFVGAGNYTVILNASNSAGWNNTTRYVFVDGPAFYTNNVTITITNPVNISNYQHNITLAYRTNMTANFSDIRFSQTDGTKCNYWIYNKTDSSSAIVWIKVPSALQTQLFMYYGNNSAVNESDGLNTFDLFDDFLGTSVNTSQWILTNTSGTITVSGGSVTLSGNLGASKGMESVTKFGPNTSIDMNMTGSATGSGGRFQYGYGWYADPGTFGAILDGSDGNNVLYGYARAGANSSTLQNMVTTSTVSFITREIKNWGFSYNYNSPSTQYFTNTTDLNVTIGMWGASNSLTYSVEQIRVRKYNTTEPILTTPNSSVASFTMSNTTGWNSVKVNFTDTSTNTPTSWNWTFGGANFSDGQHPNYTFVGAGNYTVTLIATNGAGSNTTIQYVFVSQAANYGNVTTFFINSTQNLTNYQVKIILNNTTGISNISGIFYTNGTTKVDWADIVFVDASDSLLGFWKENRTNVDTNATFWIKVPYIYSTNNTTIKMYYGCSTVASLGNGDNTFAFFDDFGDTTLSVTKWIQFSSPTTTLTNSELNITLKGAGTSDNYSAIWQNTTNYATFGINYSAMAYRKSQSVGSPLAWGFNKSLNTPKMSVNVIKYSGNNISGMVVDTGSPTYSTQLIDNTNYHKDELIRNTTTSGILVRDSASYPMTTNVPSGSFNITIGGYTGGDFHYATFDWIAVRKFNVTEPIIINANGTPPIAPIANFTMSNTTGWNSVKVNFTDTSTNTPISWNWTFGGANFSDGQNPNYTFVGAGNYTVRLNVSNGAGWNNTTKYVTVYSPSVFGNNTTFFVNSTQNLTDYQVKLILNNTTGVSNISSIFYTNGTTRVDWADIVFTDTSNNLLGFWKENNTNVNTNATFWIKVPYIYSTNNTTIKMYYGCSTTLSFADGYNTFQFFDDFLGSSLDSNWTNTINTSVSGGILTVNNVGNVNSTSSFATNMSVRGRVNFVSGSNTQLFGFFRQSPLNIGTAWDFDSGSIKPANFNGGTTFGSAATSQGTYYIYEVTKNSTTNAIYSYNNANFQYIVANLDTGNRDVLIYGGTSSPVTLDWVFVRKSNVTGPVIINANGSDIPASIANFTMSNTTGSHPLKVNFTDTSINTPSSWNWSFGDGTYSDAQYPNKTFTTFGNYTIILNASNIAGWSNKTQYVLVSNFTDYIVTTYTSNGTFTVPANVTFVEYLVVAGGGGGGARHGGGGGAGGLLQGTTFNVTSGTTYNITVGAGGAGDVDSGSSCHTGGKGTNSSFGNLSLNITSVGGGGGGGGDTCNGANGGSGGGATSRFAATGGSNVSGQGWAGGTTTGTFNGGGGGGGAGEAGHVRSGTLNGTGGNGTQSNITGTLVYYAGGGGAGTNNSFGGLGGGGAGGYGVPGTNGSANTGGGGGGMDEGAYVPGGNGGSGIVIIRYLDAGVAPVANFTMSNTTGWNSLVVNFTDNSTNTPASWNWTFGGANYSSAQNPTYTFNGAGNYSIILNATNSGGSNSTIRYVLVDGPANYGNSTTFFVNSTQNLVNYQVKMVLNNTTGVGSSNGIFYTNGTTRTDWADIVFTDTSDNLLGYWKENSTQTSTDSTFWIKVPSISSSNTTKVRMYYGNSTRSVSWMNGFNTFLFFDDFLGSSLNATNWYTFGSLTATVSSGELNYSSNGSGIPDTYPALWQNITSVSNFGTNYSVIARSKTMTLGKPVPFGFNKQLFSSPVGVQFIGYSGNDVAVQAADGVAAYTSVVTDDTNYHVDDVIRNSGTSVIWKRDGNSKTVSTHIPTASYNVTIGGYTGSELRYRLFDWIAVKKYNESEPIIINTNYTYVPSEIGLLNLNITNRPVYIESGTAINLGGGGIQLNNGTYLVTWQHNTVENNNAGRIDASMSSNFGSTWTTPYALQNNTSYWDAQSKFLKFNRTIYHFYTVSNGLSYNPTAIFMRSTTDDGVTWSSETQIVQKTHYIGNAEPIKLLSGRIILPTYEWNTTSSLYNGVIFYSDDNATTWSEGGHIVHGTASLAEVSVAQVKNGTLYASMREQTSGLVIWGSRSANDGITWTPPVATSYLSPKAMSVVTKTQYNTTMLIWDNVSSASNSPRNPFEAGLSVDNMSSVITWAHINSGSDDYSNFGVFMNTTGAIGVPYSNDTSNSIFFATVIPKQFMTNTSIPIPDFNASPLSGTVNSTEITFTDMSNNSPTSWLWKFGNGVTNSTQNPKYTYPAPGLYTVSLTSTNANGSDTITRDEYIFIDGVPPVANFTMSNITGASPLLVNFTDTSSNSPISWNWSFGGANFSNAQYPNYTFVGVGNYTVVLNASNAYGFGNITKYVNVTAVLPIVNFTSNVTSGLMPLNVMFNDTSSDSPIAWNWSFGDGIWANGTTQNVTHIYTSGGSYTVTLLASNAAGVNSTTKSDYITVYNTTVSGFAANVTTGVIPLNVGFNVTTVNDNATQWNWSFGDGTWQNGTTQNVTHVYTLAGTYSVVEIASNPYASNTTTRTSYIVVSGQTISGFAANVTTGVVPLNVQFNVTTPNDNATYWNWSFGDGTWQNGTSQNATHVYSTGGIYTVIEIASNPHSTNTTTMTDYITVYNQTIANISSNVTSGLTYAPVQFNASNSTNATWWNWSFGDGNVDNITNESPLHIYTASGNYTVNLTTSNDGWGENTQTNYYIQIYDSATTGFIANTTVGIYPLNVGFNVTSGDNATQWNWSFGDGTWQNGTNQNATHVYSTGGIFTVTEIASNPHSTNTTTMTDYITVYNQTIANISSNVTSGLTYAPVQFNASNSTNATWWNWSFGDGAVDNITNESPLHVYTASGNYTVNLTTSNDGWGENTQTNYYIQIYDSATTGFVANTTIGVYPLNVGFNVTSGDNATQWNWSFGDGTWQNGTTQNATHVYSTGGIFTVIEIASNPHSTNTTTMINYITVYNQTIANITSNVTSGLTPTAVQFYANTSTNATWWNWSFGDGNVSNITVENPVYTYTSGGNYTVTLTTSNNGWGEDIITPYYIQVYDTPITGFDANITYGLLPLHVGFNVTNPNDHATSWNWSFGDGTFGNTQNVTHIYTTGGNYTVYEIATNPYYSNVTSRSFYIRVFSPTSNTFTSNISSGYVPLNVLFTAITVNATWLNWSWGDGTWSNVTNGTTTALHIFTLPQNHTVNLTSSENGFGGCTTTHYINSTFYGAAASFTAVPSSGVPPLAVVFTDTSTNIPVAWNWSFGDGTYSNSQNVNHTYSSVGVYTVILNASNTFGWSNYSRNITVYSGAPVANFTVNNSLGASPLAVRFSNDSTYTNASSVTWYWQFGDGGTSYDSDPVHTYTINGVYHANVTLTDEIGNDLSSDTLIYVTGSLIPIPDFIGVPTSGTSPLNVTFTDLTLGGKTGWNWSFGDGNYSNAQNPVHNYTSNGQYTVTLVVANGTLSNYTTKVGYINVGVGTNVVNADYYGTPVTGNYPLTVQFYDTSICNPICNSWNWDLDGDGATDSNAKNPVFTYNYPLTYSPKLIASNGVNSGTRVHVGYIIVGPTYMPTTIPQPTGSWVPGYQDNDTGLSVSFRGDASTDLNNGTYLKYWLQNFTTTGNFNVYGFVTSVMAPLMHVFGFWIFLIIWGLYIFAVWIRAQDVTLPLIIGIISMGTFGLLFPKEALPVIIIMFVICGAIIITKLMKDSI